MDYIIVKYADRDYLCRRVVVGGVERVYAPDSLAEAVSRILDYVPDGTTDELISEAERVDAEIYAYVDVDIILNEPDSTLISSTD